MHVSVIVLCLMLQLTLEMMRFLGRFDRFARVTHFNARILIRTDLLIFT